MATHTCGALTKSGLPCRTTMNLGATGICVQHDPERLTERRQMQSAGGMASKVAKVKAKAADPSTVPPRMKSLSDAVAVASWITDAVLRGEIDARTAESATKAVRQFQLGEEKATLLREITKLRGELADARKDTPTVRRVHHG